MKSDNFFYWMQGYFEISGTDQPLTDEQGACISKHIAMVVEVTEHVPARVSEIAALLTMLSSSRDVATAEIRKRISDEFIHVIDPEAGDPAKQARLNHLHGSGLGKPILRC